MNTELSLSLLMSRVSANYSEYPLTSHYFALVAALLYRCSYFHDNNTSIFFVALNYPFTLY